MKVGDIVTWTSQSQGFSRTKTGKVILVVPAGKHPFELMSKELKDLQRMYDGWARDHESYVVEVQTGKTPKSKPALYWPRTSWLKKI